MNDEHIFWAQRFTLQGTLEMLLEQVPQRIPEALDICGRLASAGPDFLPNYGLEPDLRQTLGRCREIAQLAVNTNRGKSLNNLLEHFHLEEFFPFNVTLEDVVEPKPHPEGLLKLIDHYQAEKARTVFVGDSASDAYCAVAARVWFVSFDDEPPGWPISTPSLADLPEVLNNIRKRLGKNESPAASYRA
jgi:phosphoglycolate phosphatase-like HAD superfamily hydrolase